MMHRFIKLAPLFALTAAAACATASDPGFELGVDGGPNTTAGDGDGDGDVDGAPPGTVVPHLLLTEVAMAPAGAEFIEIMNPTASTVDLRNYYVSDSPNYFVLPASAPSIAETDFLVRFPPGATLEPNEVIVVAMGGSLDFQSFYGNVPDYSIVGGDGAEPMVGVAVGPNGATLTNGGEAIVLMYWDGRSDLVSDVDLLNAGQPSSTNALSNKSGRSIDGPDEGSEPSTYATDLFTMGMQDGEVSPGVSTKRIAPEDGSEDRAVSGNGITGDDETSEILVVTWDRRTAFTSPAPFVVDAALTTNAGAD